MNHEVRAGKRLLVFLEFLVPTFIYHAEEFIIGRLECLRFVGVPKRTLPANVKDSRNAGRLVVAIVEIVLPARYFLDMVDGGLFVIGYFKTSLPAIRITFNAEEALQSLRGYLENTDVLRCLVCLIDIGGFIVLVTLVAFLFLLRVLPRPVPASLSL